MAAPEKPVRRPDHFEHDRKVTHFYHECIGMNPEEVEKLSLICSKYVSCDGFCGACKDEAGKLEIKKPVELSIRYFDITTDNLEGFLGEMKTLCDKFAVKKDGKPDYAYDWEGL